MLPKRHKAGSHWRILVHERIGKGYGKQIEDSHETYQEHTEFDELVIDEWIHLEQMDTNHWWMRLGPLMVHVTVGERGQARTIQVEEDFSPDEGWILDESQDTYIWKKHREGR